MALTLFNTMSRAKEEFVPLQPGKAGLYCCGPTVYNFAHIGNLRTYVFEDVLRRALKFNGYDVLHVMNITDVGHLESDEDEGEDKLEKGAAREGLSVWEIARKYENFWLEDMQRLNIERPEVISRATEHVAEMIALIERILSCGCGYVTPGAVYFDTSKFASYAELARLDLTGMQAGAGGRVKLQGEKKHQNDFVLWFLNKPRHIMQWESPWGPGYPGWHIECSAMSMKYLGETFDIHCGGVDHIPVHHTNEIAQSECATGRPFVRYWMHGEFLVISNKEQQGEGSDEESKMSKSSGNFITLSNRGVESIPPGLIERGIDPLAYRYLCLQAHYRSELRFSWETLEGARAGLRKVYAARPDIDPLADDYAYNDARQEALAALNDDLNMPQLVGILNRWASFRLWKEFDSVLGLDIEKRVFREEEALPTEVAELVQRRNAARAQKEWKLSDDLRAQLTELGFEVGDSPQGTTVKRRLF
jgi:cysteinyl-tRNA synthetase